MSQQSPLADPLVSALFLHHRDHAPPELIRRLLPVMGREEEKPTARVVFLPVKISSHFSPEEGRRQAMVPTMALIMRVVSRFYGVPEIHILSCRRTPKFSHPRQVFMYLAHELTTNSLPQIGRFVGGKDHTTVLHGVRKIAGLVAEGGRVADEIDVLKLQILDAIQGAA